MKTIAREPLYALPGHFYSPVPSAADAARAEQQRATLASMDGIDLRVDAQLQLAEKLGPFWAELPQGGRYKANNSMYGLADGAVYYSMLQWLRPKRIIEVGSGFSSAIALDFRDDVDPAMKLTFIEPYPQRLLGLLRSDDDRSSLLIQKPVQDVDLALFESLGSGDILFIDSSHVSKAGSDVNWLFFVVLPRLQPGVVVHIHDIFYPFEYQPEWLEARRAWNENYLLRAFLTFSSGYEIELFSSWLWSEHADLVERYLPPTTKEQPGSIWLRRT